MAKWLEPSGAIDLWLAVGDSEMEGAANSVGAPAGYPPSDRSLIMVRRDLLSRELTEPCGQGNPPSSGWGPAGMFAWLRAQATGTTQYIVNAGWAGARSDHQRPDAATPVYSENSAKYAVAYAFPDVVVRGVIHFDGYNNAAQNVTTWATDWSLVRTTLCTTYPGLVGSPWIYVKLKASYAPNATPALATIRAQQDAWEGIDAYGAKIKVVCPEGSAMNPDNIHMTSAANYALAQLLHAAVPP